MTFTGDHKTLSRDNALLTGIDAPFHSITLDLYREIHRASRSDCFNETVLIDAIRRAIMETITEARRTAGPDLLDALEEIHKAFVRGEIRFTHKRQSDNEPYHIANVKMTAALAKARGNES